MRAIKFSIKRALCALGFSQKTITHLSFSYTRGKRNARIALFLIQTMCRQNLIGGGRQVRVALVAIKQGGCLLLMKSAILASKPNRHKPRPC